MGNDGPAHNTFEEFVHILRIPLFRAPPTECRFLCNVRAIAWQRIGSTRCE